MFGQNLAQGEKPSKKAGNATRPKRVSYFQILANQANAERSTGPRTPEGKARSAQNAYKHGFRATYALMDEDPEAIEAAYEKFIEPFNPRDEVARTACDLAFRLKRRLERIEAAQDAEAYLNQQDLDGSVKRQRNRFIKYGKVEFDVDPRSGVYEMKQTEAGLVLLEEALAELDRDLGLGKWTPSHSVKLLALMEVEEEHDATLDRLVEVSDGLDEAERMRNGTGGFQNGTGGLVEARAPETLKLVEESIRVGGKLMAQLQATVRKRIAAAKLKLSDLRLDVRQREMGNLRAMMDKEKVGLTPDGQLLNRYHAQAVRELKSAMDLAIKICGYRKPAEVQASASPILSHPVAKKAYDQTFAPPEPNRPVSDRAEQSVVRGREVPSTDVRDVRRA